MHRHSLSRALIALTVCAAATGCGGEDAATGDEENIAETKAIFGDDRVGAKLASAPRSIPGTYPEVEELFGIGRKCSNDDSKEIYVVEESSSRAGGEQKITEALMPRAIVTGCNTDRQNPDSAINSFGLMVALFSSPDAPNAAEHDPMVLSPVEVMALDMTTGLYNFYVFEDNGAGSPGTVNRIQLRPDDTVVRYRVEPGKKMTTEEVPDRACQNCHANMGPVMNELSEPWTNWVSTHKQLPEAELAGETRSIVDEAIALDGGHNRSSFANDLEPTMRAAMRVWIDGLPGKPRSGFGPAVADGDQPGGIAGLLESVFCQTELNYASAATTVPVELFVDPAAVAGAGIAPPNAYAIDVFPTQLPVRSEMDKRIEKYLIKQKYVSLRTATAIRIVDDTMDVFSSLRCGLYDEVKNGLPSAPADVDAHVRKILSAKVASGEIPAGPGASYISALIDPQRSSEAQKAAQTAYYDDARARFQADAALLETAAGRAELRKRVTFRKEAAKKMFPGPKNPLPILEAETGSTSGAGGSGAGGSGAGGSGGGACAHDECAPGDALDAACSPCAAAVCATDPVCCQSTYDDICVGIAEMTAACACN